MNATAKRRSRRAEVVGYGLRKMDDHDLPVYLEHYCEHGEAEWTSIQEASLFFPSAMAARGFMVGAEFSGVDVVRYSRSFVDGYDGPADEEVVGVK